MAPSGIAVSRDSIAERAIVDNLGIVDAIICADAAFGMAESAGAHQMPVSTQNRGAPKNIFWLFRWRPAIARNYLKEKGL